MRRFFLKPKVRIQIGTRGAACFQVAGSDGMDFNIIVCPSYGSAPEDIDSCGFIELGIRDGVSTLGDLNVSLLR